MARPAFSVKHVLGSAAGLLLAATPTMAATVYDANAAFVANENNAATQTSSTFGPFAVGIGNATDDAGNFTAFSASDHVDGFVDEGTRVEGFNTNTDGFRHNNYYSVPCVLVNAHGTMPGDGSFGLNPGEIFMHPGAFDQVGFGPPVFDAVLRFIVPADGDYYIAGGFRSLDFGETTSSILINGVSQNLGGLAEGGAIIDTGSFNITRTLAAGDFVDFVVNERDVIAADSTGLTASLTVVPEPASAGTFCALALWATARRRHKTLI